ncbi:tetratricopeptide repeat protein 19 homolog, mitochondrial [Linepithema humile]|uniref:tetratricopeptide repeat protein 19 homolog, mitochondrial n=1 Tax=Linepithema humile TaxID=83485 RepID=UPI0006231DD0|nr:PREDICTED: tetratricopeptide repeat protein 19 homolog, mitochondrial isoform X1 [Linepithema humile]XP_012229824.1 PREDICTED: tetratricopeptide repeat protein 19 homolog, mitochondrial isoform X1 [Linepithema humile]XP_012229825.1 PREDICTED: tetratricopeptide repeat protein 19 homolog, mitochondrial isoform X1 [Linepithema humile]XP_012229826.1 PREDICTED: tetratricopeptide repeat protein 19 homolog, mitochondrial isoform X1 [Linepithema humile]XP_012229827.1 PREDICTED: tetratricopeptide rep
MNLVVKMYRLNLAPRVSRCILSNTSFTRSAVNVRRNIYIYKNTFTKSSRFCALEKYRLYDNHESQKRRSKMLLAVSLPTLIFNFLLGIEDTDEEPEVITTIKRSVLLIQKGEFEKAERMLHLALRQAQTIQHYDAVTYVYDVMANLAFDTEDYHKAEKLFVSVLQRLMSNGASEDDMRVIHISLKMAKVFEHMKEIKKADQGYKFCMEHLQSHIEKDPENKDAILLQGMTFDWYARMLLSQSRHTEAFNYFLQAYDICKKINGEEHEQTVILLNDLGTVSCMQGEYDEAIKYLSAAARIGNNLSDMTDLGSIHVNLGNVFLKKGLYDEARRSCQAGRIIAKNRNDNDSLLEANECLKEVKRLLSL